MWPSIVFFSTYGENAYSAPATMRDPVREENRPASPNIAQPDNVGANKFETL